MTTLDIAGLASLIVGCFVGLAGWLKGRDDKISTDSEWKGGIDAKLDAIHTDICGTSADLKAMQRTLVEQGERLTSVEESAKQAHKRIDRLEKGG